MLVGMLLIKHLSNTLTKHLNYLQTFIVHTTAKNNEQKLKH